MNRRTFIKRSILISSGSALSFSLLSNFGVPKEPAFIDRLLPASLQGGFYDSDYWIWGSSVIKGDDGKYHMFASRWLKKLGFGKWVTNSEIVHAVANSPVGPYKALEVALPSRGREFWDGMCTHNPRIVRYNDMYLLFYFGNTYDFPKPTIENAKVSGINWSKAWMNKRIGVAFSKSLYGPWRRLDKPVLEPRPGHWDATITSNPAPVVNEKTGEILLMYKSSSGPNAPHLLGMAVAINPEGPYARLSEKPIFSDISLGDGNIDAKNYSS
ncbi:glycoside hydrolase family protein [Thermophagus sp. OGC60D27]|uniref:glycoside hydrolase family protein n=1 Tax=Thermophagus sp. OGC60D27 TaxID=3458415 RepID=UPI004038154D